MNIASLSSQPLLFNQQYYPKVPYYTRLGSKCTENAQCNATCTCQDNICKVPKGLIGSTATVFASPVIYSLKRSSTTKI